MMDEQNPIKDITEDDLLDIIEGKKIGGVKITKQMRSNIKHAMKRRKTIQMIKKKYLGGSGVENKKLIRL